MHGTYIELIIVLILYLCLRITCSYMPIAPTIAKLRSSYNRSYPYPVYMHAKALQLWRYIYSYGALRQWAVLGGS